MHAMPSDSLLTVPDDERLDADARDPRGRGRSGSGFDDLTADYEFLGELGRGGSAVVYHARDRRLGREVALKVVRVAPAMSGGDDDAIARLAREARTIAQLEHPHIVRVHAVRELRDGLALEMPRIGGRTLKQLIADEGPLDPTRASVVLADVASALAFAHAHGVVHRDVKPENIFVDDVTGRALLADFGVARSTESDARLTQTGVTVGTPAYMSPEQIEGRAVDGRSDLYSLGLVGWEMLTGRRPWEGEGLFAVLQRQQRDLLPPVEAVRPASAVPVPATLQYIVERLMQKAPGARWADAGALAGQLARPVLPADFAQWKRAHARRVAESQRGPGLGARGAALLSTALTTMRLALPGDRAAAPPAEEPASEVVAPSWGEPATSGGSTRRVIAGGALLVAGLTAVLALRARDDGPLDRPLQPIVADAPAGVPVDVGLSAARPDSAAAAAGRATPGQDVTEWPAAAALPSRQSSPDDAVPAASARGAGVTTSIGGEVGAELATRALASSRGGSPVPAPSAAVGLPSTRVGVISAASTASTSSAAAASAAPAVPVPPAVAAPAVRLNVSFERTSASAGGRHSCVVGSDARLTCWGANDAGQLGTGDLEGHDEPAAVASDTRFSQVTAGGAHSCAVSTDAAVFCWGDGERGQLGTGARTLRATPARVSGASNVRGVRAGLAHTCALTADGSVLCWGANDRGQLGDGSTRDRATAAPVAGLRASSLAVGWRHDCALTADGTAYCWGDNSDGQLGDGSRTERHVPTVVGGGMRFAAIAAGAAHTCAVATDGRAFCWGRNVAGQLGTGSTSATLLPSAVDSPARFVTLVTGSAHSCGRSAAGLVSCWGSNTYGQLGDGSTAGRLRPVRVAGGPYTSLSASGAHTCATLEGSAVCWGYNVDGQLGDGTRAHRTSPMRVTAAEP